MLAVAVSALLAMNAPSAAAHAAPGQRAYETSCASCHGADLLGTADGPTLLGAGAADLDFQLMTGRMPADVPWIEIGHRGAQLQPDTIAAIEGYVLSIDASGPPIPEVAAGGDLTRGRALYEQNCQHCHGIDAGGAAIGGAQWAPTLHDTSITQVAEAIRVGPGEMPQFGERQLGPRALDDVATYVTALSRQANTPPVPFRSSGPVPEGLVGWLAIAALSVLAFAFSRGGR